MHRPSLIDVDGDTFGREQETFRRIRQEAFTSRGLDVRERALVRRDGRRSYLLVAGTSAIPTVLVHGGVGSTAEWAPLAPLIPGRVVIPDTPGFGLSDAPAAGWGDTARQTAAWIADVADALDAERINLVGCSMGGYAALNFALAHPDRVGRLILAGSAGGLFADIGMFLKLWTLPGIGRLVSSLPLPDREAVRKRMLGPYVGDPTAIPDDLLEVALAGDQLPGARARSRALIRAVATFSGWRPELRLDDALAHSHVDTTFVWGDRDIHAQPRVAHELAQRMVNARAVIIPGAGHLPHLDHAEEVADVVREACSME